MIHLCILAHQATIAQLDLLCQLLVLRVHTEMLFEEELLQFAYYANQDFNAKLEPLIKERFAQWGIIALVEHIKLNIHVQQVLFQAQLV